MNQSSWRTKSIFFLDWRSIVKTFLLLLFLAVAILFFLNFGYVKMLVLAQQMDHETNGQLIAREAKYSLTQSLTGNKKTIEYIKLTYQYKIDTLLVTDTYHLYYSLINATQLNKINSAQLPMAIKVKYNQTLPYESMVWVP